MPDYVHTRLARALNERGRAVSRSRILVLGLAYKANTSDARESPAVTLVERLARDGADVAVHDPHVADDVLAEICERVPLTPDEVRCADAVVLVTDHADIDYSVVVDNAAYVLDTRNRLEGSRVEHL